MKKYEELLNSLLINDNGVITRKEAINIGVSSSYFSKYIKENNLIKITRSEYINSDYVVDYLYLLQKRYPHIVFSGYTALYLNKLIDSAPQYIEFTMLKKYRVRKESIKEKVRIHIENNEEIFNFGNIYLEDSSMNEVFSFSKEKVIVEMIRKKNEYNHDIYIKALKNFLNSNDKSFELLFEYAKRRKIEDKVNEILELLMQ